MSRLRHIGPCLANQPENVHAKQLYLYLTREVYQFFSLRNPSIISQFLLAAATAVNCHNSNPRLGFSASFTRDVKIRRDPEAKAGS